MSRTLAEAAPDTDGMTSPMLGVFADLQLTLGGIQTELRKQSDERRALNQAIRYIPQITIPQITTTNGEADYPDMLGPRTGQAWEVRRITVNTFSAGTVGVYLGQHAGGDANLILTFPVLGTYLLGGGQLILQPNDRLVFRANSITGNATCTIGVIEIEHRWLGAYLL